MYRRLFGPKGQSGRVRKIWPATGLEPSTVQSVAGRYPGPLLAKSLLRSYVFACFLSVRGVQYRPLLFMCSSSRPM